MKFGKLCMRITGLIRFHIKTIFHRKSVSYVGAKQYMGKDAKLSTSENGLIRIGKALYLSDRCTVESRLNGILTIGDNNFFNRNISVVCLEKIQIGNNNLFAQNVVIVDHDHNYQSLEKPICRQGYVKKAISIGSDCWICANCVICSGSQIGDHIVVAANSVVKGKLIEPGVYAGIPAKLIKKR